MSTVLVVDDDDDIARFIADELSRTGYHVRRAGDGVGALAAIHDDPPDLVLLDDALPDLRGLDVCRRLRADPETASLPVIMLSARDRAADRALGLAAGADDYLPKPFDPLDLVARVGSTLRRNAEMRSVSPLTGLPGNHRIDCELAARVADGRPFALCYLDLDNFKAFNDSYGFLRGDDVIVLLASALRTAAGETSGDPPAFIGHVGGDDFVLICAPEQVEPTCTRIMSIFDAASPRLHDPVDVGRGSISVVDRQGTLRDYPLVSVSIGVATSERHRFRDHREAVAIATEMKSVAKSQVGSSIAIDRRIDPATSVS